MSRHNKPHFNVQVLTLFMVLLTIAQVGIFYAHVARETLNLRNLPCAMTHEGTPQSQLERQVSADYRKLLAVTEENSIAAAQAQEEKIQIHEAGPKPMTLEFGTHILPHPEKGEDALFVKGRTFGIFDGVSGAEKEEDFPLYSETLAAGMKKAIGEGAVSLRHLIKTLDDVSEDADEIATGASTALLASIGKSGLLQALNLGDSSLLVIRDGKVTARTHEISHFWQCPYQLSEDSGDEAKDGTRLKVQLFPGDLILMGSDGIFDNLDDDTLLGLIAENNELNATQLSRKICDLSRKVSQDDNARTPFSIQSQQRGNKNFKEGLGGKEDDASCVVVKCK